MPIFIKKRVLTEKISKMFNYADSDIFSGKSIAVTNEHFTTMIKGKNSICLTVWTHVPINLLENDAHEKASEFYKLCNKNNIKHQGIIYCGKHNFINSGFINIECKTIFNNKTWIVIDALYDLGSILKKYISEFVLDDIRNNKIFFDNLEQQTKKIYNVLNENCEILNHGEFFKKFKY